MPRFCSTCFLLVTDPLLELIHTTPSTYKLCQYIRCFSCCRPAAFSGLTELIGRVHVEREIPEGLLVFVQPAMPQKTNDGAYRNILDIQTNNA